MRSITSIGRIALFGFVLTVAGCGLFGPTLVDHAFSFDVQESPGVEVLDYRYGDSSQPGARASEQAKETGRVRGTGIRGDMLRGDDLYVKWRWDRTGKIYEDTVDLKKRMPRNIENHEIHFRVSGARLHVYLITPEPRPINWPNYLDKYRDRKVLQIYPDPPKPNRW